MICLVLREERSLTAVAPKVLIMKEKSKLVVLFFGTTSFINSLTNNMLSATDSFGAVHCLVVCLKSELMEALMQRRTIRPRREP